MPSFQGGPGYNYDYPSATTGGGEHTHTFTPSITDNIGVTDNISVSLGNGDVETRPVNYTIRVWKRIA